MFDNTSLPSESLAPVRRVGSAQASILLVCTAVFGLMTGQQMVNPILAPLARELGLTELGLGVVMAVGASGVVFASGFWARKALVWGHRAVLLLSLTGAAIGLTAFAVVAQVGLSHSVPTWLVFALVVLSRGLVFGLAWAATPATAQSYIAGATPGDAERIRGMSTFGAAQGLGLAVGPALGGLLSAAGLLLPMYIAPAILVLVAIVLAIALPRPTERRPDRPPVRVRMFDRRVWPFLLVGFGLYTAITVVLMTLGFLIQDRLHLPSDQVGVQSGLITLAGASLIVIVQALIVPRLAWPPHRLIRIGCLTMTVGMVMVALAPTSGWLAGGVALLGAGLGFGMPGVSSAPSLLASAEEQGSVAGLITATVAATFVVGPLLGDGLYEWGTDVPYLACAGMLIVLTVFALSFRGIRRLPVIDSFRTRS
jgi:MFS family permease